MKGRVFALALSLVIFVQSSPVCSEEVPAFTIDFAKSSNRILLTSNVFSNALALVEEKDGKAEIVHVERFDPLKLSGSRFISDDGQRFGAVVGKLRSTNCEFRLYENSGATEFVFPAFGNRGYWPPNFAASSNGSTVLVPGTYGVVCWKFQKGEWKENWAIDLWKQFDSVNWVVEHGFGTQNKYNVAIPQGGDLALVQFNKITPTGDDWQSKSTAYLAALELSSGKERWRFDGEASTGGLYFNIDGSRVLLADHAECFFWKQGKLEANWDKKKAAEMKMSSDGELIACAYLTPAIRVEVLRADGKSIWGQEGSSKTISLAFGENDTALFTVDSLGELAKFDLKGTKLWSKSLGTRATVVCKDKRVFVSCFNGMMLQALNAVDGSVEWSLDCSKAFGEHASLEKTADKPKWRTVVQPSRKSTTSNKVPAGANLLSRETATLKVVTRWFGKTQKELSSAILTNGKKDEVSECWLDWAEFVTGERVFFEIEFQKPSDVQSITVYENPDRPDSWPTEGLVERWDEDSKSWKTAAFGLFMIGPVNTYKLDLKAVKKIRYIPWNGFTGGLYTTEIEVR